MYCDDKLFLLGAVTSAHQVEGNNTNSDSWALENLLHTDYEEPSMDACDHYNRYEEDIRLMAEAGLNAYRFSVEWARIEPEEGYWDEEALRHYEEVIRCCRDNGIEPVITLHHFTTPVWVIRKGGWEAESIVQDFADYAACAAKRLGKGLKYICTINEANIGIEIAALARQYTQMMMAGNTAADAEKKAIFGTASPQVFLMPRTKTGDEIIMKAHVAAREAIRAVCPEVKVGVTLRLNDLQVMPGGEKRAEKEWQEEFLHYLPYIAKDDFLGVQNYTRSLIGPEGPLPVPSDAELTQMGYEFYPEGLQNVLIKVEEDFHGDLLVTGNGAAVEKDKRRAAYIRKAMKGVRNCIGYDFPVRGYFYESLLDNYEWKKGYSIKSGLISVDRKTQERTARPSLYVLRDWGIGLIKRSSFPYLAGWRGIQLSENKE